MSERIDAINLWELETRARELLPQMASDYYASGANDEITLRENRAWNSRSSPSDVFTLFCLIVYWAHLTETPFRR